MEVLSLLKYWRGGGGGGYPTFAAGNGIRPSFPTTTISASATPPPEEESSDDDGPFFDLEFTVPDDESDGARLEEASDEEREFDLTSADLASSPSEFGSKPQILPVSLLRAKLRVLMLGLRKQKDSAVEPHSQRQGKLFTVKFKVEEVPIVSLFTRDSSSRNGKPPKPAEDGAEKKPPKELVQKYLGKIKPLYVRVSKRQGERSRISEQVVLKEVEKREEEDRSSPLVEELPKTAQKQNQNQSGGMPAGLRVVCKHLGKSRSASAAVAAVPSPPPAPPRRRDDSLLQLQDGIQSAIAHCKMSLSVSKEPEARADCGEKAREDLT